MVSCLLGMEEVLDFNGASCRMTLSSFSSSGHHLSNVLFGSSTRSPSPDLLLILSISLRTSSCEKAVA